MEEWIKESGEVEKIRFPEKAGGCINYISGITIYDYSDVEELDDIAEWYMGEGMAV